MNTHKPTKKEVPDNKVCWLWLDRSWKEVYGSSVRASWEHYYYWLPYDALPDPRNQQINQPRKDGGMTRDEALHSCSALNQISDWGDVK